jgi:uncharacterized protein with ParB-like and HNH nuclease domain
MSNNHLIELNIKDLFSDGRYVIPIYQRNFAWGESEITQLIQDVADSLNNDKSKHYYLGTLVVWERMSENRIVYETIDGQQRLTALILLLCAIKYNFPNSNDELGKWFKLNLEFDSRLISTDTLLAIYSDTISEYDSYNTDIKQAYDDTIKSLKRILRENNQTIEDFSDYLYNKVMILRVSVPNDTDLNHYFEIMNNRGEQLEKHEILKAKCLDVLKDNLNLSYTFNVIWEACSNMEKYVQYGFKVEQRNQIFGEGDWNRFSPENIDDINDIISNEKNIEVDESSCTLKALLDIKIIDDPNTKKTDENPDRFNSVITFPNFLLHVLRIQTNENISLDDKQLLATFLSHITNREKDAIEFVKLFGYNLLKIRFLFDKYIIKRDFSKGSDKWSLKQLKCYSSNKGSYVNTFGDEAEGDGENRNIIMLLAMFHVSIPTMGYKHWLNASLKFVFENSDVIASEYIKYLENLSEAYLYDRFLSKSPIDYFEIIFTNKGISKNENIDETFLNQGTAVENFIFNYLDYLLWKKFNSEFESFEFTLRSSVEHYYPQNPIDGYDKLEEKYLNNFGNLCLISTSKNSKLNNLPPDFKKAYYLKNPTIDSIKQKIMMKEPNWWKDDIERHSEEMKKILLKNNLSHIINQD